MDLLLSSLWGRVRRQVVATVLGASAVDVARDRAVSSFVVGNDPVDILKYGLVCGSCAIAIRLPLSTVPSSCSTIRR